MNEIRCCKSCRHFAVGDQSKAELCQAWDDGVTPAKQCREEYLDFGCEYWKPKQRNRI